MTGLRFKSTATRSIVIAFTYTQVLGSVVSSLSRELKNSSISRLSYTFSVNEPETPAILFVCSLISGAPLAQTDSRDVMPAAAGAEVTVILYVPLGISTKNGV